jgi:hypothetical protein
VDVALHHLGRRQGHGLAGRGAHDAVRPGVRAARALAAEPARPRRGRRRAGRRGGRGGGGGDRQTLDVPGGFALDGRLDAPARYVNAAAAMLVIGIRRRSRSATRREWPAPARAVALAVAAGLAGTTILTQSRGAVAGGIAGFLVLLVLVPRRLALLVATAIAGAGVVLGFDTLLDVRLAARAGAPTEVLEAALPTLARLVAGTAAAGLVWALVDGRAVAPARVARGMRRGGVLLAVAAVAAGSVAFVSSQGSPIGWAQDRWDDFRTENYGELEASGNRFTGDLGSNRYDYWRVAVLVVRERPLTGTGAGGFAAPYKAERRTVKGPLYAHSFWMQTLSDLGLPGMAAVLAWLLASLAAVLTAFRRAGPGGARSWRWRSPRAPSARPRVGGLDHVLPGDRRAGPRAVRRGAAGRGRRVLRRRRVRGRGGPAAWRRRPRPRGATWAAPAPAPAATVPATTVPAPASTAHDASPGEALSGGSPARSPGSPSSARPWRRSRSSSRPG